MADIFFGTTTTLNRFSFLRSNPDFISKTVTDPESPARLVFYKQDGKNGIHPFLIEQDSQLGLLNLQVNSLPGSLKSIFHKWVEDNKSKSLEIRNQITMVFLGLDEDGLDEKFLFNDNSLSKSFKYPTGYKVQSYPKFKYDKFQGTPYFSVDVTHSRELQDYLLSYQDVKVENNMLSLLTMSKNESSLFAYSKMYMDWLMRNKFCPGCGSKVVPVDAGTRLFCHTPANECPVKSSSVSNVCFPRTDPVIIVGAISADGKKILLGNNKRHPVTTAGKRMFSCIAGFMEPGETIEESTLREIWEETGCSAREVRIASSQPWPFPANLMIGCFGVVHFDGISEIINTSLDNELSDCRWFDVEDVKTLINNGEVEDISLPMEGSIAYELIKSLANGKHQ
ncbi:hypothetical protein OGAPHI_004225 [Ogataea philodendri]|uniref:NAD(+) diphosphatase n=1 Tax=Ogataea philodendri TaxID=1378263 RepID=A0A9P8T5L3_9ASCO|nr:uncharacterized protein OGAPHI_004225 [Ogataea philodendri]KAH3666036.1 hypothetical protein OGAPHI_004225 [Ogataea philodendri]